MLSDGAEGLRQMREEAHKLGIVISTDQANAAAEFNDNISRLTSALRSFGIGIAQFVLPFLNNFVLRAKDAVLMTRKWMSEHPRVSKFLTLIITAGPLVAGALGGILILLPLLASGFATAAGIVSGTFLSVLPLLIAIGGALFAVWKKGLVDWGALWEWLQDKFAAAKIVILEVMDDTLQAIRTWLDDNRERISTFWQNVKDAAVSAWAVIWSIMQQAWQAVSEFWRQIQPTVMQALEVIRQFIFVTLEGIMNFWNKHHETIKMVAFAVWMTISDVVKAAWAVIQWVADTGLKAFTGDWEGAWDNVASVFKSVWTGIKDFFKNIIDSIAQAWDEFIGGIISKFESLILKIPFVDSIQTFVAQTAAKIPAFADGGLIPHTGKFLVGERGPEILDAASGRIFSNRELQQVSNSNTINVTVNTSGGVTDQDARRLANIIRRELNRGKY